MKAFRLSDWIKKAVLASVFLLGGLQAAYAQINDRPPVPVVRSQAFNEFVTKFAAADQVDAFYFFKNFPDFKGKLIMLDARFTKRSAKDTFYATIWRNYGSLNIIVTDVPEDLNIPPSQPFLLAGLMTDFKNEIVNDTLEPFPIIKFLGIYFCKDSRCNQ